jgi:hypothetical protein
LISKRTFGDSCQKYNEKLKKIKKIKKLKNKNKTKNFFHPTAYLFVDKD